MVVVLRPCFGLLTFDSDFLCAFVYISPACFYYFHLESSFDPQALSDGTPLYKTFLLTVPTQPRFQLLQRLMPQRRTFQSPPLSMFMEAVMVHMVVPSLQILWRVGSFLQLHLGKFDGPFRVQSQLCRVVFFWVFLYKSLDHRLSIFYLVLMYPC